MQTPKFKIGDSIWQPLGFDNKINILYISEIYETKNGFVYGMKGIDACFPESEVEKFIIKKLA